MFDGIIHEPRSKALELNHTFFMRMKGRAGAIHQVKIHMILNMVVGVIPARTHTLR